jgi:hypothetical protein
MFGLSYYAQSRKREVFDFKRKHPLVVTLAVFSFGYYLVTAQSGSGGYPNVVFSFKFCCLQLLQGNLAPPWSYLVGVDEVASLAQYETG